jgi:prevent-host-death family protein
LRGASWPLGRDPPRPVLAAQAPAAATARTPETIVVTGTRRGKCLMRLADRALSERQFDAHAGEWARLGQAIGSSTPPAPTTFASPASPSASTIAACACSTSSSSLDQCGNLDHLLVQRFSMHIPISEAKGKLTELVRRAEAGEEIILTRHGHLAVRLAPVLAKEMSQDQRKRRRMLLRRCTAPGRRLWS